MKSMECMLRCRESMCRDDGKVCVCEENVCDDEAMCLCREVGKCLLATYTEVCALCRIEYPGV